MKNYRVLRLIVVTILCLIIVTLPSLTLAQGNSPFEIEIIPAEGGAVMGEQFVYTIVVTNVSAAPVKEAVVSVYVPEGAKFIGAKNEGETWYATEPAYGAEEGRVIWFNQATMARNEEARFELIVEVVDDITNKQLVNEAFTLVGLDNRLETGSGPEVEVPVYTPTSTPTPTITPTPTATLNPTQKSQTREAEEATAEAEQTRVAEEAVAQATVAAGGGGSSCMPGLIIVGLVFMAVLGSRRPITTGGRNGL
jgi:uncharacterized repeat protein (TIGR01451 family)